MQLIIESELLGLIYKSYIVSEDVQHMANAFLNVHTITPDMAYHPFKLLNEMKKISASR